MLVKQGMDNSRKHHKASQTFNKYMNVSGYHPH